MVCQIVGRRLLHDDPGILASGTPDASGWHYRDRRRDRMRRFISFRSVRAVLRAEAGDI